MSRRLAFLGPEGTYASEAARLADPEAQRQPLATIQDVVDAVREGRAELGVVPIENSIEGSVNFTLDALAFGPPGALIRAEIAIPISINLLVKPGTDLAAVREVRSQPHALAQCRQFLTDRLPGVELTPTTSTAEAARQVAESDGAVAALGTRLAAEHYGLEVGAQDTHDFAANMTRFVVLGPRMAAPTGADKTSMVVFFGEDRPGLLLRILDEFALRGINLTKIESRPTKQQLGEYCIFIDADGHPTESRMAEALRSVHRHVADLRILGAYRRADGLATEAARADSEGAYRDAASWYAQLLDHMDPS